MKKYFKDIKNLHIYFFLNVENININFKKKFDCFHLSSVPVSIAKRSLTNSTKEKRERVRGEGWENGVGGEEHHQIGEGEGFRRLPQRAQA